MDALAGVLAAFAILGLGILTRQEDALPFYSTVLIVIALVYVLFAVMAGRPSTIVAESVIAGAFVGVAIIGARSTHPRAAGLLIAAGLILHGAYDLVHDRLIANAVVPGWWPVFCTVVDVVLGGWLGYRSLVSPLNMSPSAA